MSSFLSQIRFQPNDHKTIKETADELKIFEGIKHPNLVRYFGVELHRVGGFSHSVRARGGGPYITASHCSRFPGYREACLPSDKVLPQV